MRPVNIASKNGYRGLNLWATADELGYTSGTPYKQWAEAGAQVRKSEKASYVVFYKKIAVAAEDSDEAETRLFARVTPVFAAEQVDGYQAPAVEAVATVFSPIEAETFVARTGAIVHHGGNRAYYRPSTDSIQLTLREAFVGSPTGSVALTSRQAAWAHPLDKR